MPVKFQQMIVRFWFFLSYLITTVNCFWMELFTMLSTGDAYNFWKCRGLKIRMLLRKYFYPIVSYHTAALLHDVWLEGGGNWYPRSMYVM